MSDHVSLSVNDELKIQTHHLLSTLSVYVGESNHHIAAMTIQEIYKQ